MSVSEFKVDIQTSILEFPTVKLKKPTFIKEYQMFKLEFSIKFRNVQL